MKVLDHGIVELIDSMGNDLSIVNAAKASFNTEATEMGDKEKGLLGFLAREEHGVPFETVVLKYQIRLPIFLARQFVKHRTSSWDEQSGRYDELSPLFYQPENVRRQVGKPGAYTFEPVEERVKKEFQQNLKTSNALSWSTYQVALQSGVGKEVARLCLPVNLYTNVIWTLNLRSLFNVLHLRNNEHAQYEAQVYAAAMEELAFEVAPEAMKLFVENGRKKV